MRLSESSFKRAYRDTVYAQKSLRFMWGGGAVFAVAGAAWLAAVAPNNASTFELAARTVIGGLTGLLTAVAGIFLFNLIVAPYKQRNEARSILAIQQDLSVEIGEIRLSVTSQGISPLIPLRLNQQLLDIEVIFRPTRGMQIGKVKMLWNNNGSIEAHQITTQYLHGPEMHHVYFVVTSEQMSQVTSPHLVIFADGEWWESPHFVVPTRFY